MKLNLADFAAKLVGNRARNEELSPVARAAICSAVACGKSYRAVADAFGVSVGAVQDSLRRWETQQSFDSKPRKGRPQKLSRSEKRYILTLLKRNRHLAKKALVAATESKVSYSTIRRCLRTRFHPGPATQARRATHAPTRADLTKAPPEYPARSAR